MIAWTKKKVIKFARIHKCDLFGFTVYLQIHIRTTDPFQKSATIIWISVCIYDFWLFRPFLVFIFRFFFYLVSRSFAQPTPYHTIISTLLPCRFLLQRSFSYLIFSRAKVLHFKQVSVEHETYWPRPMFNFHKKRQHHKWQR